MTISAGAGVCSQSKMSATTASARQPSDAKAASVCGVTTFWRSSNVTFTSFQAMPLFGIPARGRFRPSAKCVIPDDESRCATRSRKSPSPAPSSTICFGVWPFTAVCSAFAMMAWLRIQVLSRRKSRREPAARGSSGRQCIKPFWFDDTFHFAFIILVKRA